MAHHKLKIKKEHMEAKQNGEKPFEIRGDDQGFQKGDTISFISDNLHKKPYPGKYEITYVTSFGQRMGVVVFATRLIAQPRSRTCASQVLEQSDEA